VNGITPAVDLLAFVGLIVPARLDRITNPAVGKLVDVNAVHPVAVFLRVRVELADLRIDGAAADRDDPLAIFEGPDGAQIDGAGNALTDDRGQRRFVDIDLVDDLGRILVIFDGAVVAGRGLFAAVEQRRREVRPKAAD